MGFWGTYIIGRSDQPLEALDALKGDAQDVCWRRAGHDGWQIIQIHRGPAGWSALPLPAPWEGTLVAIMEQTQRPVLAITELDMHDLYRRVGPPAPQAADLAARWAREACLVPDPAVLLSALESGQFTTLLRGLGLASLT